MAMSTGKVVALIKAMGGGADPAVIEAKVQDWLDAHPEATTTVQDGSITEQKLATSIAQKLGLISSLSDEIDDIGSDVTDLKSALDDMIIVSYSDNRLDPNSQIADDINTSTGVVTPSDYYSVSGKMPCQYGESLYVVAKADLTNQQNASIRMAFYTSGDSFIEIQQNVSPFVVPQNAAYCLLRTNKNFIIQEKFGVFPYSGATMSTWIPYFEKKTLSDDYAPIELSEEVAANTEKTAVITAACGENLIKSLTFSQQNSDNIVTDKFTVKANVTYTLTYKGAVDNGTAGYVSFYEENAGTYSSYVSFPFKDGYVTFTPPTNTVEAKLQFFKSGGLPVSTFTFADPCLVYGVQAVDYVDYKEKIAASSIPNLPERMYTNDFGALKTLAHMGQSYYFPQNTIWSWLGAKKAGFDYIECDLQITADNVIVIIHDPDMRRYGGTASQTVTSLTFAQLQTFDAGAWFNKAYEGTTFPVFSDFVGIAKALGIKLALDCKGIDTAAKIDAVATILETWGMLDEVIWITGNFNLTWARVPNAKILWAAGRTLVNGDFAETVGGWFNGFANNFPDDKKEQKTITIKVNGVDTELTTYVMAEGAWFGISQDYHVANTYGISDLQLTAKYAKTFGCHFGLYAVDDDDDIFNYIQSIPELDLLTSNRTTVQSATCRKYGIGVSDRPQNIGSADL